MDSRFLSCLEKDGRANWLVLCECRAMFKIVLSIVLIPSVILLAQTGNPAAETASTRLAKVLKGEWQSLDVALVIKSSCMGPVHRGQRITRQDGRIEMRSLMTSGGVLEEGSAKAISAEDLRRIIASVEAYYGVAERSEGRGEWLAAQIAGISDRKERDMKIAELMRAGGVGDTVSIEVSCKTGTGKRTFDDEFEQAAVHSFSDWVIHPSSP